MKVKLKDKLSRVLSLLLVVNMVLALVIATDTYYFDSGNKAYAAGTSDVMGTDNYNTKATIHIGSKYNFGGIKWMAAEAGAGNYSDMVVLQAVDVVAEGKYPGYILNNNSYGDAKKHQDTFWNADISSCYSETQSLYAKIKNAEYTDYYGNRDFCDSYGNGLYLINIGKLGFSYSDVNKTDKIGTGLYNEALREITFYKSNEVWVGKGRVDYNNNYHSAYTLKSGSYSDGSGYRAENFLTSYNDQTNTEVIAPAFNLDIRKVGVNENNITLRSDSTGISAVKTSIQSIKEGEKQNLSDIISKVTYVGGTAAGNTASYKVTANRGSVNGTTYIAPSDVSSSNDKVTFTITSTHNEGWKATIQVNLVPKEAGKIEVTKKENYPDYVTSGNVVDFSKYLTVKAIDIDGGDDGEVTNYDVTGEGFTGNGYKLTAGVVTKETEIPLTVTATQGNYNGKTYGSQDDGNAGQLVIKVKPGKTGYTDRDGNVDDKGFHEYKDKTTGITWKYKYDDNGNIRFLYTENAATGIINKSKVLVVPSSIDGVPVVGIGGGRKNGDTIPFIPTTENTWTSIYIPSSVQYINDEAFEGNQASANIVIPNTVKQVGVKAFKDSKITSLTINTENETVELFENAFENIPTLEKVAIYGSHAVIGKYAFKGDSGIINIDIPNGTKFLGESGENNSYAFSGTTGLESIKINTDTVYSNIFSGNKSLKKVIFGENVNYVNYDWAGTSTTEENTVSGAVANRSTYVLNTDTIFEIKTNGSPFGYAGNLTVVGKKHAFSLNDYTGDNDKKKVKVAYLADNMATEEAKTYAKGTADSISITVVDDPSSEEGVGESESQTGIEAYSSTIVLTDKKVDKDKITVYKMYNTSQKGKYTSDEFYILRSSDAQELINKTVEHESSNEIEKWFADKDSVKANEDDLGSGVLDLTVIVLQKDENGSILTQNGKVKLFTCALAIPVKEYTAEDDFLENYGSYDAVISKINDLNKDVAKLTTDLDTKSKEYDALKEKADQLQKNNDELNAQIASKEKEIEKLQSNLTATEKKLTDVINSYAKLLDATKLNKSDYTYTVTKDGVTKYYVFVNGEEAEYDINSATDVTLSDGKKVTVYTGTFASGDTFKFYIADDGVHVVTLDEAGKNVVSDNVSTDTVAAMQRKIAAQLQAMKDKLTKLESALDEIAGSLNIGDLDSKTDDEKVEAIKAAIAALNKKVSDLEQTVASKDKLIESLKEQNGQQAATIEQANATIKKLNEQITAVKGKLQETQEALDTANKNLDTATGNLSDAQQQITTISGNLQKTENDLATAQEALAEKQTDLDAANALIESTNAALTKAQGDLSTARNDLANVQKTLSDTQAELEATKTALNTANTSLAGAQQEITSLNAEVENLRNTIAGYQSVLNSIKKALGLTDAADNAEILASISDLDTRLGALDEKIASLAAMLGIDTAGKSDNDLMEEIISKVTDLTKDYDTVTKNYNKIVRKIYGADDTVDVSNKSVDEVLAAIDSLSGDTSVIAKQLQEAITGKKVSDSNVKQLTELLEQVKTMKSDLDQKGDLLNQIMQALGITDSAQIIQTIVNLKTQVASLEKENAELKAGGATTGKGYTKDTEVNSSSASYTSGYNAGYAKAAKDLADGGNKSLTTQVSTLTSSNSSLTKENSELKAENESLTNGIDDLYDQVTNAGVSTSVPSLKGASSAGVNKLQKIGNAFTNLVNENKNVNSKYKSLKSSNGKLSDKNKALTKTNAKLVTSEKNLKAQVSGLKSKNAGLQTQLTNAKSAGRSYSTGSSNSYSNPSYASKNTGSTSSGNTGSSSSTASQPSGSTSIKVTGKSADDEKTDEKKEDNLTTENTENATETVEDTQDTEVAPLDLSGNSDDELGINDDASSDSTEIAHTESEDQKSNTSANPFKLVMVIIIFVIAIAGIVFFVFIKPRLDEKKYEDDDEDSDEDDKI